jgi:hypothetical protein
MDKPLRTARGSKILTIDESKSSAAGAKGRVSAKAETDKRLSQNARAILARPLTLGLDGGLFYVCFQEFVMSQKFPYILRISAKARHVRFRVSAEKGLEVVVP